ncbi:MAG: NAD(P)H-binding protein [Phycisphaerales bacterium]
MNTHKLPYQNVLVIAANGKTGRRVVPLLEERGVRVRRGSRSSIPVFDWGSRDTWREALAGMDAVYVVYQPDLAVPAAAEDIRAFMQTAKQQGVRKVVLLSGRGVKEAQIAEQIVAESGLDWTFVRAAWFDQNFSEGDFAFMIQEGVISLPMGDAVEPIIDADDIAEVVANAFTDHRLNGETLNLSGPEALTHGQIAAQLSKAVGYEIRYLPISTEDFRVGMAELAVPEDYIDLLVYLFEITVSGVNAQPTDDVERVLGRAPRAFSEFALKAASQGVFAAKEMSDE